MSIYKTGLAATLISTLIALAGAQETPPARDSADPPASPPAEPEAAPRGSAPRAEDDVFIPSEEVQADEELAFPVDI